MGEVLLTTAPCVNGLWSVKLSATKDSHENDEEEAEGSSEEEEERGLASGAATAHTQIEMKTQGEEAVAESDGQAGRPGGGAVAAGSLPAGGELGRDEGSVAGEGVRLREGRPPLLLLEGEGRGAKPGGGESGRRSLGVELLVLAGGAAGGLSSTLPRLCGSANQAASKQREHRWSR